MAAPFELSANTKSGATTGSANSAWLDWSGFTVNYGNGNTSGKADALPWWVLPAVAVAALVILKKRK